MKKLALLFTIAFLVINTTSLQAQKKLKESDVLGTWKLVIDVDDAMDEAKEELREEDNFLGGIILGSVTGLIENIIDEIEIYIHFRKGGEAEILVNAFGERETEYTDWSINKYGELEIDDTEHYHSDNDQFVLNRDGILVPADDDDDSPEVYFVKVDD